MHHKTKEKYLKLKESGLTPEELKAQMLADGISDDEASAFIAEALLSQDTAPTQGPAAAAPAVSTSPASPQNATVPETAAEKFNYKNLTGDNFKKYEAHVQGLPWHNMLDFQVYKVNPVITERYPGLKDSPKDMTGIEIVNDKPIHHTRVDVKTAMEMNAQVRNTGRYYLLK